jgi:hypothetical protein
MEPLSVALSLLSFSASTLVLIQNFIKSADTLRRVQRETTVLQHILGQCAEIVTSQNHPAPLPESVERTLLLCHEDHLHLLHSLDRLYSSKKRKLLRTINLSIRDEELMASYHSFRDSVLLLRDLSAE